MAYNDAAGNTTNDTEPRQALHDDRSPFIKVAITDLDGVLRGKYLSKDKVQSSARAGLGFCNVVLGWDVCDSPFTNTEQTGWHTGFPDAGVHLDWSSLRHVPWDNNTPFVLGEFVENDGTPHALCPRQVLKRVLSRVKERGYEVLCGVEFEWYNFAESPKSWNDKNGVAPEPITPGMFGYSLLRTNANGAFVRTLLDELRAYGIPVEGLHAETGPGVYEVALAYTTALRAADHAILFKAATKEIGHRFGIMPSFIAKWNPQLPGCSGHVHQSLTDGNANLFFDDSRPHGISRLLESYIAGQLKYVAEFGPLFWPNINSYKRLVDGFWAPLNADWGVDNRTASLRVIPGGKHSTRLETRCPGADANPYLSIAASIAAGMAGIEQGLTINDITTRDRGQSERNPRTLDEATQRFATSATACDWLGERFVQHFSATRRWEWEQYQMAVTDWELKRYLEII